MKQKELITLLSFILIFIIKEITFCVTFVNIEPNVIEKILKQDTVEKIYFKISNPTGEKIKVNLEVQEYWSKQTGLLGVPIEEWLIINTKKPVILKPYKNKKIYFKVKTPKIFSTELMAMVFFSFDYVHNSENGVAISTKRGIPIYVIPDTVHDIEIKVEDIKAKFLVQPLKSAIEFNVKLYSKSNIHLRPKVTVKVKDDMDTIIDKSDDWGWPIFPNKSQDYFTKTTNTNWDARNYKVEIEIDYGNIFNKELIKKEYLLMRILPNGDIKFDK